MPRRTIPDGSGARVSLLITNPVEHTQHYHSFHVDQLDTGSGLYTTADSASGAEETVFATVTNYMAVIAVLYNTEVTIDFVEALGVHSGVASVYIVPTTPVPQQLGLASEVVAPSRAAVSTLTTTDIYRNRVRWVYAGIGTSLWTPNTVPLPDPTLLATQWDRVAGYLMGKITGGGTRKPRIVTRAGGELIPNFRLVPSLNRRLRRAYKLD